MISERKEIVFVAHPSLEGLIESQTKGNSYTFRLKPSHTFGDLQSTGKAEFATISKYIEAAIKHSSVTGEGVFIGLLFTSPKPLCGDLQSRDVNKKLCRGLVVHGANVGFVYAGPELDRWLRMAHRDYLMTE